MGRPRKPTKLLELGGAFEKNPQRRRQEPEPHGELLDPPKWMAPGEREIWYQFLKALPEGMVFEIDFAIFELAVKLTTRMRHEFDRMTASEMNTLRGALAQLGFTPADRSRVMVKPKTDEPDGWDEF